jgi:hypothetical protein
MGSSTGHELPDHLRRGGPDISEAPQVAEEEGLALLAEIGRAMVACIDALGPGWAVTQYEQIAADQPDDWAYPALGDPREVAEDAGRRAADRVVESLRVLFAQDPEKHRATPQQIIRTLGRELTEMLVAAGAQGPRLDPFHRERFPDDPYGLAAADLAAFGDDTLPALSLAFGVAKTRVIKARRHPLYRSASNPS